VAGFANRDAGKPVTRLVRPRLKTSATPLQETAKAILNHQPDHHRMNNVTGEIAPWIDKHQSFLR